MKKKILSILLVLMMVVSLVPSTVFAEALPTLHEAYLQLKQLKYAGVKTTTDSSSGKTYTGGGMLEFKEYFNGSDTVDGYYFAWPCDYSFGGVTADNWSVVAGENGADYQLYYYWSSDDTMKLNVFVTGSQVTKIDVSTLDGDVTSTASFTPIDNAVSIADICSICSPKYHLCVENSYPDYDAFEKRTFDITCDGSKFHIYQKYEFEQSGVPNDPIIEEYDIDSFIEATKKDNVIIAKYNKSGYSSSVTLTFNLDSNGKVASITYFEDPIPVFIEPGVPDVDVKDPSKIKIPSPGQRLDITPEVKNNDLEAKLVGSLDGIELTSEEQASGVWVWMQLNTKEKTGVNADDAKRIEKALGANKLGTYLDISLFKQVSGQAKTNVTTTTSPLTISVVVPQNLRSANRKFSIVYTHDGADAKEITPESYDNKTGVLTFKADKFSTYALAYNDAAAANTGDSNVVIWIVLISVLLASGLVVLKIKKH